MQWHNLTKKNKTSMIAAWVILSIGLLAHGFYLPKPQPIQLPNERPVSIPNLNSIHLFGIYKGSLADLPKTTLPLTLQGTFVTVDSAAHSYAIISSPNHPTKMYRIGDMLPGDATLTQIDQHTIALSHQGRSEKLDLPIENLN